jgi:ABC-type lipoprotein export system ATPase subunit
MVVFDCDSYHLVKVCIRGICAAVGAHDDLVFLHGCVLSVQNQGTSRGVAVMGSSGAGKTTLVAKLSERPGYAVRVVTTAGARCR